MVTGVLSSWIIRWLLVKFSSPESSMEETRELRDILERELIRTIPDDKPFNATEAALFDKLCIWLKRLYPATHRSRLGIVTTNYDMLSDVAAYSVANVKGAFGDWRYEDVARKIDFGFR